MLRGLEVRRWASGVRPAGPPGARGSRAPASVGAASDAPAADADACNHGLKGTADACAGCQVEQLYTVPSGDAGNGGEGPFIFGVATDGVHLYWLEQRGTKAYDGTSASRTARASLAGRPAVL